MKAFALACKAFVEKISGSISVDSDEKVCSSHIAIAKKKSFLIS